jgi:hypothetical protein
MKPNHRGLNLRAALTMLLLCCDLAHCLGQSILQITFDGPPIIPTDAQYGVTNYYESGMLFKPLSIGDHQFTRVGIASGSEFPRSLFPDNGSAYLDATLGDSLTFNFTDGSAFGLASVDLAEYSTVVPNAVTVEFVGYHPDGSTVTETFTTDGIIDGTGPLADFQTFNFTEFTDVTRVEIPSFGWSLDNLVIDVPEPTSSALLLVGGLVLGVRKLWQLRR